MRLLALALCSLATALACYFLLAPRTRWTFGPRPAPPWRALLVHLLRFAERQLSEPVLRAADALGWPVGRIVAAAATLAAFAFLFLLEVASPLLALAALPFLLLLGGRAATGLVLRRYQAWQQDMVAALPILLAVLRVHLDLGRTVPDALAAALAAARGPLQLELARTLSDIALLPGRARASDVSLEATAEALRRLAYRVGRIEFRTFADTVAQAAGSRLSGDALAPIQELLRISREREAEELAGRLDLVMTTAPGFALFGLMIWAAGGWILANLQAGLF